VSFRAISRHIFLFSVAPLDSDGLVAMRYAIPANNAVHTLILNTPAHGEVSTATTNLTLKIGRTGFYSLDPLNFPSLPLRLSVHFFSRFISQLG
jgi:hypothetical protein